MPEEKKTDSPVRPWWVRLAIPATSAERRHVMRNVIVMSVLGSLWGASMIALAFMEGSNLYPYRFWILAFFVVAAIGSTIEFMAIRWTDRAGLWPK